MPAATSLEEEFCQQLWDVQAPAQEPAVLAASACHVDWRAKHYTFALPCSQIIKQSQQQHTYQQLAACRQLLSSARV